MKITLKNYEAHVLDYLDGELTAQEEAAFVQFLDNHPEVRSEIAGVNELVVMPDPEMNYPDKSRLYRKGNNRVVFLWGVPRFVAAAIALLLISTAAFFIWKSGKQPLDFVNQEHVTNNSVSKIDQPTTLPATRIPVPENDRSSALSGESVHEEQSETKVMAQKGNVPDSRDNIPASPALNSGKKNDELQPLVAQSVNITIDEKPSLINIPNLSERNTEARKPGIEINNTDIPNPKDLIAVSFLPVRSTMKVDSDRSLHRVDYKGSGFMKPTDSLDSESYKIHIPGEFLSDTWADVSVAKFKKKLIPQFIKNQLNL